MTTPLDAEARVKLATMTPQQRDIAIALCGNAWQGYSSISPGIAVMNDLELMHIDVLKDKYGTIKRYKARPTLLGSAVRAILSEQGS
jgi:hypothetical protein